MSDAMPVPPAELVARIGGTPEQYLEFGRWQRHILESLLPADWSFEGKSVLDLGCGPGRTLCAFGEEAERGEFVGCDIDPESIAWASAHLSPPFGFHVCGEAPPLPLADERFDLVYGMSVFSHITDEWSRWLVEVGRVMRPGAIAVFSVLGPVVTARAFGIAWDERTGMASFNFHQGWEIGGPSALLAEWWVREHWGRAFEIVRFAHPDDWFDHDFVVMRRRETLVSAEELEAVDHRDAREWASLVYNLDLLKRQQRQLGDRLREAERERLAERQHLSYEVARRQDAIDVLTESVHVITNSRSWRVTAPLRRMAAAARSGASSQQRTGRRNPTPR
jgi:SAM-dependent methyltransferase